MDYISVPLEGKEVVVNTEGKPSLAYDSDPPILDWSIPVKPSDVSEPVADVV